MAVVLDNYLFSLDCRLTTAAPCLLKPESHTAQVVLPRCHDEIIAELVQILSDLFWLNILQSHTLCILTRTS